MPIRVPRSEADGNGQHDGMGTLEQLLADTLVSMFEVQDFIRLMMGEAMRDESTARAVGLGLFTSFQSTMEDWVRTNRRTSTSSRAPPAVARLPGAMVVGIFVQHAAGCSPTTGTISPPWPGSGPVRRSGSSVPEIRGPRPAPTETWAEPGTRGRSGLAVPCRGWLACLTWLTVVGPSRSGDPGHVRCPSGHRLID